jgi:hypothetical protein
MLIKIFVFTRSLASAKVSIRLHLFLVTTEFSLWLLTCRAFQKSASNSDSITSNGRSQWPRHLRHELSSPARTLGSPVPIPLEAWMSVWVYSAFALSSCLATVSCPVQGVLPTVCRLRNWKSGLGSLGL